MKIKFLSQLQKLSPLPTTESMSFSLQSPNLHVWDNAAADSAGSKTWLPLQPISINLARLPKLHSSKRLVPAEESENSGLQNTGATAADEAEIEEIKKEIRRLSVKLNELRTKKADKDLRDATAKPFVTKVQLLRAYRRRGLSPGKLEKEGKSRKRIQAQLKKGISTVGAKAQAKTVNANFGSFKPRTLLLEKKNLVTGEKPAKNNKVTVLASRHSLRSMEPESKRRS